WRFARNFTPGQLHRAFAAPRNGEPNPSPCCARTRTLSIDEHRSLLRTAILFVVDLQYIDLQYRGGAIDPLPGCKLSEKRDEEHTSLGSRQQIRDRGHCGAPDSGGTGYGRLVGGRGA